MDKFMECSQLDCMLMGMIVVLVLCLAFNPMREKFDTSLATRSQVGDATNLDTVNGMSGSLNGDVYDCNAPILMVQPDNAYTWGDSKNYMSDESLNHLHPNQVEHAVGGMSALHSMLPQQRNRALSSNQFKPVFLPMKQNFVKGDPSNQYQYFNKSDDVMNRHLGKEGFAEHLKRNNEGFDTHNSESTLAAVMKGYSPTAVVPQHIVQKIQKMPFTAEMLRGGAKVEMRK